MYIIECLYMDETGVKHGSSFTTASMFNIVFNNTKFGLVPVGLFSWRMMKTKCYSAITIGRTTYDRDTSEIQLETLSSYISPVKEPSFKVLLH